MSSLILPSVIRQQPRQLLPLDRSNPLGAKVIEHIALNGVPRASVSGAPVTYGPGGSTQNSVKGRGLRGTGSASRASLPLDLSKYSAITIAFWLCWDSYANDDALAMEMGGTYSNNAGFIVDPNCSSPAAFMFGAGGNATASGSNLATFPRPSAGAWHRIALVIDRASAAGFPGMAYVDGVIQPMTSFPGATVTPGNFGADTVHLLSRNESSLFGAGNLQDITIYRGSLSQAEAVQDYINPWQIFKSPARKLWAAPADATNLTATITWTDASDAALISAVVTSPAALSWMDGSDTASSSAIVTDTGTLTWTEQGDVQSIGVVSTSPPMAVSGSLAWTEAGDSTALSLILSNKASVVFIEQGDTWSITVMREQVEDIKVKVRYVYMPRSKLELVRFTT